MESDEADSPVVSVLGPGKPVAAIVSAIHGDEPSGVYALRRLERHVERGEVELERAVTVIIANPPALEAHKRFIESDLNRSFPGDPEGTLEERLALQVLTTVSEFPTLSLHATRSHDEPFAIVDPGNDVAYDLSLSLPIPYVVRTIGDPIGSLGEEAAAITLEVGRQGTAAAVDSAVDLIYAFLQLTDALPGEPSGANPTEFDVGNPVDKPPADTYSIAATNFERVEAGEVFATANGEEIVAEEPFYPILFSADGYDEIFGFRGWRVGDGAVQPTTARRSERQSG